MYLQNYNNILIILIDVILLLFLISLNIKIIGLLYVGIDILHHDYLVSRLKCLGQGLTIRDHLGSLIMGFIGLCLLWIWIRGEGDLGIDHHGHTWFCLIYIICIPWTTAARGKYWKTSTIKAHGSEFPYFFITSS